jgi:hypothetical protein
MVKRRFELREIRTSEASEGVRNGTYKGWTSGQQRVSDFLSDVVREVLGVEVRVQIK